ncbi:LysR family transcriptional regulator [Actinomycetes bacterium KLBMP 9759]
MDSRISLYKLEVLCAVVELGGAGRAAARMFVSQPVISEHIRSLEQRLSTTIFDRTTRGLELTEAGRCVYGWARDILRRSAEMERDLAGLSGGTAGAAAIATSMTVGSYLLPPVITRFVAASPDARVTVHVFDPNQIWEAITSGLCDFGVPIAPGIPHGRGLAGELVGHQDLILVGPPDPTATQKPMRIADVAALPFVSAPQSSIRRDIEDAELAKLGITDRKVVVEFGHPEAIKHAVTNGLGFALLFRASAERELEFGTLREILIDDARPRLPIYVVWRSSKRLSPMQRALITAIRDHATSARPLTVS